MCSYHIICIIILYVLLYIWNAYKVTSSIPKSKRNGGLNINCAGIKMDWINIFNSLLLYNYLNVWIFETMYKVEQVKAILYNYYMHAYFTDYRLYYTRCIIINCLLVISITWTLPNTPSPITCSRISRLNSN